MPDDVRRKWREIVEASENQAIFASYRRAAGEPRTLFEAIGEKLGSSREEERAHAYSAFYLLAPDVSEILYERESRQCGYRSGSGEGPRLLNQGMDIITHLYLKLVKEQRFKVEKYGTDPRPFVRRIAKNWQIDEARRRKGKSLLSLDGMVEDGDEPLLSAVPDPAASAETEAIEPIALEQTRQELRTWASLDDDELALFEALSANDWSLEHAAIQLGIPSPTAGRKRLERFRTKLLATRDSILLSIVHLVEVDHDFDMDGQLLRSVLSDLNWEARMETAFRPGPWAPQIESEPNRIRPLTRSFSGGAGNLYFRSGPPFLGSRGSDGYNSYLFTREFFGYEHIRSWRIRTKPCGIAILDELLAEAADEGQAVWVDSFVHPDHAAHPDFLRMYGYGTSFDNRDALLRLLSSGDPRRAHKEAKRILKEEALNHRSPLYRAAKTVIRTYPFSMISINSMNTEGYEAVRRLCAHLDVKDQKDRHKALVRTQSRFFV